VNVIDLVHLVAALVLFATIGVTGVLFARIVRRDRAEQSPLLAFSARQRELLDAMPEAAILLDEHFVVVEWNHAAESIYGYARAEAVGRKVKQLLAELPGSMRPDHSKAGFVEGATWHGRFTCHDKAGKRLVIEGATSVISNRKRQPIGYFAIDRDITEQSQLEEQFVHQATLLSAVQDALIAVDRTFHVTEWNRAAELLYEYSSAEAVGQPMTTLLHTTLPDGGRGQTNWKLDEIGGWQGRLIHYARSGKEVVVSSTISHLYDEQGNLTGFLCVDRDMTDRAAIERALATQNGYLDALNKTTLALINRLDLDELLQTILERAGSLVDSNDSALYLLDPLTEEMTVRVGLGYCRRFAGRKSAFGKGISGWVWEHGRTRHIDDYAQWEGRSLDPAMGVLHSVIALPIHSDGGRVTGVLCLNHLDQRVFGAQDEQILTRFAELASIAIDNARLFRAAQQELAERARAEAKLTELNLDLEQRVALRTNELRDQQAQLVAVLDAMGEGVAYLEKNIIRFTNRAMAELTGRTVGELINHPRSIFLNEGQLARRWTQGKLSGYPATLQAHSMVRRKNGTEFEAALTLTHLDPDESAGGFDVLVVRDITEEKQLEEQKSKFIANASHELRTPLTNLKTRLYLLRRQPERSQEHLGVIERVTGRMAQLVDDLLDVTRFERGAIQLAEQVVTLQGIVRDVVEMQRPEAARKQIALTLEMQPEPVRVVGDADRLTQVMVNLVINAVNYTPDSGSIFICLNIENNLAQIRIIDTGMGIGPEHMRRIFEPFFRASEGAVRGTGLGLSISREIARLHGGDIVVHSEVAKGSTFILSLPLAIAERA